MKAKTSDNNPYGWDVFVYDDKNNPIFFLGKDYTRKSDADELTNEFNSAISAHVAQETAPLQTEIDRLKQQRHNWACHILKEQLLIDSSKHVEYFKVKPESIQHKGLRFFRFINEHQYVIQVCLETNNETKRGKGHYIGIYKISRVTFFSNYFPNSVVGSTEHEFNEAVDLAMDLLLIGQPKVTHSLPKTM